MTIPVICEECGKLYHIPKEKLRSIKGDVAKTRCRNCGFIIMVNKSDAEGPDELEELDELDELNALDEPRHAPYAAPSPDHTAFDVPNASAAGATEPSSAASGGATSGGKGKRSSGLGLRAKMIVLFLVVPLGIMAASGYFSQRQTNLMVSTLVNQSSDMVSSQAEQNVANLSTAVARQIQLYLDAHPELAHDGFSNDTVLSSLAVQKVGSRGFTFLYTTRPFTILTSPFDRLNGKPLSDTMRATLGGDWQQVQRIIDPLDRGQNIPRKGYYMWQDRDGTKKKQYVVMTPILGTDYGVAAASYVSDFAKPLDEMKAYAGQEAVRTKNTNFAITVATLIIIGAIVTIYGHALVNRIKMLTDVADRISVGELDAEITLKSKDELGLLADAIARMQDSLRLSIMRLRRKR